MPTEGWIDAPLFIQVLLEQVRHRGGEVRCGARVQAVRRPGTRAAGSSRVMGIVTEAGESFEAGWVVNCAGPDADRVAAMAGVSLPMTRVPGLLLVTDRAPVRLRQVVHPPGPSFRPAGGGRVVILTGWAPPGSPDEVFPSPSLPPPAEAGEMLSAVARWLPALAPARVEAARLGVRPMPLDGYPIVGPHPKLPRFYQVVTHSGITLGPVLGPLVAAELSTGRPEPRLAPYRPERVFGPSPER